MSEAPNSLQQLLSFLEQLDERKISFTLRCCRREAIMVCIDVPGERWEIEFFADGEVETEVFMSESGVQGGEDTFDRLFRKFSD